MTQHQPPTLGAFIRPVGMGHGYCYQVLQVHGPSKEDPREVVECKRWGIKDGQPFSDGYHDSSWLKGLRQVLPGVWKDEWEFSTPRWGCCPLYYRLMTAGPTGQIQLF